MQATCGQHEATQTKQARTWKKCRYQGRTRKHKQTTSTKTAHHEMGSDVQQVVKSCCCAVVLLCCCAVVLLCCCAVVLSCCRAVVLLFRGTACPHSSRKESDAVCHVACSL